MLILEYRKISSTLYKIRVYEFATGHEPFLPFLKYLINGKTVVDPPIYGKKGFMSRSKLVNTFSIY